MPVSDPTAFRDKREDWMQIFREQRVEALRPFITAELIAEHRANPRGPHSPTLQEVLNFVRGPAYPLEGKPFVYVREPYRDYRIARMTARGAPVEILPGERYTSEREAQHAAFLHRLAAHGLYDLEGGRSDV